MTPLRLEEGDNMRETAWKEMLTWHQLAYPTEMPRPLVP